MHERELSSQLGRQVFFMPHVAPFFRGITITASMSLATETSADELTARYLAAYKDEALVTFQSAIPHVRDIQEKHGVVIGGLSVASGGLHAVVVAVIDNLLGGAATQALRNLNLALGFPENTGVST
jgi:N-acetyl-gamma-glutamyl-phosphate reductase